MIIRAKDRHYNDAGWLKTYWLFSFSDYYDENNIEFGNLRVFNDDIIKPNNGFSMHPHREMEIVTIILKGQLTHEDDQGNKEIIKEGQMQVMTAGTGIVHSEYNDSKEECHLYQIWIKPNKDNLKPSYRTDGTKMNSDAKVHRITLEKEEILQKEGKIFIYLTNGKLEINGEVLEKEDQSRTDEKIKIKAKEKSEFILIEC